MSSPGGIVRTESGRQTYAPDGLVEDTPVGTATRTRSNAESSDTSGTLAGETPYKQHGAGYLTEQGKEEVEDPIEENPIARTRTLDFEPIHAGDRQTLTRLATQMSRSKSFSGSVAASQDLERQNTLTGLQPGDEVLDPASPKFDLYKWIRLMMSKIDEDGVKHARAGIVVKNATVKGTGSALNLQKNVGSVLLAPLRFKENFSFGSKPTKTILRNFDAVMKSGEMLIVLGRPGSGCSTFLKTMCGELSGLELDKESVVHYNGITQKRMMKEFKGEVIYNQEVDKHFPHLTVGETLEHAAAMRTPQHRVLGMSRKEHIKHITQVIMAVFGLTHTYNTRVGNDYIRGVSAERRFEFLVPSEAFRTLTNLLERKRVSIAEMAIAAAPLAAWDNSTRGLDSASALTFTKSLRTSANLSGTSHAVAIYQASQAIYELFDNAIVLYEGREIFFGPCQRAKEYFEEMGWYCPARQTTGDFLTSVTNPTERKTRDGCDDKVPRTPDDFEAYWRRSPDYAQLQRVIADHEQTYPVGESGMLQQLREKKNDAQANHVRPKSPYVVSPAMQIKLNIKRAYQRIWNDKASTFTPVLVNCIMALIVGSVFYGTPDASAGFFSKGSVLFFAILLNALSAISEINSLYEQRPIVEKHASYAFYRPSAIAGIIADIPVKFATAVAFNLTLYFMAGLRREPAQFFLFFLIAYISIFVMSAMFRTMAALTKTVSQAMALSGVLILAIVVYTGFVVPPSYMKVWFSWIRWINPIYYAFEILVANEFHGREFTCSGFVPGYPTLTGDNFICSVRGAVAGERTVSGDAFIASQYSYYYANVWRNFGILLAFLFFFMAVYFIAVELNSSTTSTAEVLVFRRGHVPSHLKDMDKAKANDEELPVSEKAAEVGDKEETMNAIPPVRDLFTWRNVVYDIEIKGEPRRLLDNVSGWVKPGTLTALMGTSGAGKTTLLDVLAQRTSMGVITGDMFVNGKPLDSSFQRKTGYVQQQDLHLATSTVRESLRFSAMLRQPKSVSKKEKYDYVEDVIKMLNMEDFAEAVVGVPGEGLNVEQRKLLTIGVELAAKPKLLLFLDEPTSGLDSQSSWAICAFLRKLADNGQAVLCTIHQPSAILFQQFDRLLFLRKGGQTVYFGPIGKNSRTLLDYFESNGSRHCDDEENPAEFMLEVAGDKDHDWHETWKASSEAKGVQDGIDEIHKEKAQVEETDNDASAHAEFAMPFSQQLVEVTIRVFQQYWRMPSYIMAKFMLSIAAGLFIGFSFFQADTSQQGMQNVLFSIFMVTTIFTSLVQQIMPMFVSQRELYEVREKPSKAYSWKAFFIANIIVEIPYQIIAGIITWACFYYPVVGIQSAERQGLVLAFLIVFMIFASTFGQMCIAALPDAQTASAILTLLFSMTLIFNGVMQSPTALPGFWIFMYRVSPLTYWVGGIAAALLHGRAVECATAELSIFPPPAGQTCQEYMGAYISAAGGTLQDPGSTTECSYCSLSVADQYLASVGISWSVRFRNLGLMFAYIAFNIFMATFLYWFFRVRKSKKSKGPGMGEKVQKAMQWITRKGKKQQ